MKILQINTVTNFGSTGRTTKELSEVLIKKGHQSYIAYGQGNHNEPNCYKIGSNFENHLHNINSRVFGKQGYYSSKGTLGLIKYIKKINPDIIHLRNLHGNYINLKILFNFLAIANKPVFWSLHDCWAFTGKCTHYTEVNCSKWKTACYDCPQIKKYPPSLFIDKSKEMYLDKKHLFTSIKNMTIIPVSKWLANEVEQSFLLNYNIKPIYNWINLDVFKPTIDKDIRRRYNINKNDFIILSISGSWKNDKKLQAFIKLSKMISNKMTILLIGEKKYKNVLPKNIKQIDYVESTNELAKMYTMANVYVHTSIEDTFGKVIAEAMSCGTPIIAYNSTVYPEIINENCGFIVEKHNIKQIYHSILKVQKNKKSSYTNNCIEHVNHNFHIDKNTNKIIELYKKTISEN